MALLYSYPTYTRIIVCNRQHACVKLPGMFYHIQQSCAVTINILQKDRDKIKQVRTSKSTGMFVITNCYIVNVGMSDQ